LVVEVALDGLGGETLGGGLEFLVVLVESSSLGDEGGFSLSELLTVISKLLLGKFSDFSDLNHIVVVFDLVVDLLLKVFLEESGEVGLEVLKEADASGEGISVERGGDLDEGGDGVGGTDLGELHEGLSGGVGSDGLKLGDDDLKGVKDELGLLLSLEEKFVVGSSLDFGGFLLGIEHLKSVTVLDNSFLEVRSLGGVSSDGLSGFLDLVSGMLDSGVVVSLLGLAFVHLGGMSLIGLLLLFLEVVDHVLEEVGNIGHGAFGLELESNGVEEVFTKFTAVDGGKSGFDLVVGAKEVGVGHGGGNKDNAEEEFHL